MTRARWSSPRWSPALMLTTPLVSARPRVPSSASRSAAKFRRTRRGCFQRDRHGVAEQHARVPRVGAECRDAARPTQRFEARDVIEREALRRMIGGQLRRDQHWACGQEGAVAVGAAHAQEVVIAHAVIVIDQPFVAALAQRLRGSAAGVPAAPTTTASGCVARIFST